MPQFPPRKLRPMKPEHYRRLTLRAREYICRIEQGCDPQTPHELRSLTRAVDTLLRTVRELCSRHHAQDPDYYHDPADPMAVPPNEHHPGPRCGCASCKKRFNVATDEETQ